MPTTRSQASLKPQLIVRLKLPHKIVKLKYKVPENQAESKRISAATQVLTPSKLVKRGGGRHKQGHEIKLDKVKYFVPDDEDEDFEPNEEIRESVLAGSATRSKLRARNKAGMVVKSPTKIKRTRTVITKQVSITKRRIPEPVTTKTHPLVKPEADEQDVHIQEPGVIAVGDEGASTKKRKKNNPEFTIIRKGQRRFIWNWTPFPDHDSPTDEQCEAVFEALRVGLAKRGITISRDDNALNASLKGSLGPMHAASEVTIDAIVKVIMSQATGNEKAIAAYKEMCKNYPFFVDGEWMVGKTPNYHDVKTGTVEKLEDAIKLGGLNRGRAKAFKEIIDIVHAANVAHKPETLPLTPDATAAEFVPGSLSLDYLKEMPVEELFDYLLGLPKIGIKTAACILLFCFKYPIFAVDTHVFRLTWMLDWIPENLEERKDRDSACMHLDFHIPDDLKYALHQAFWHHGQHCVKCSAKGKEGTPAWNDCVCPLEEFIVRRWTQREKALAERTSSGDSTVEGVSESGRKKRKMKAEPSQDENTSDNDPQDSRGKKRAKQQPTMVAYSKMTVEEAEERGYKLETIDVDDDFGADQNTITQQTVYWIKKTVTVFQ